MRICTKSRLKETQELPTYWIETNGIASVAIRVLTFSSKGYDLRSMIGKRLMAKIKSCKERVQEPRTFYLGL
ncbi:hypothetical protein Tco_0635104 [Tanacetum coccineum]